MKSLLQKLNLQPINQGVCSGPDSWIDSTATPLTSYNPTTAEAIARVIPADRAAYEDDSCPGTKRVSALAEPFPHPSAAKSFAILA